MEKAHIPTEALEGRLALQLTSLLSQAAQDLPHDITERLRVSREAALRARRLCVSATAASHQSLGTTLALSGGLGRWSRLAAWLPLIVLACGLYLIQSIHMQSQVSAAAEVDAVLLADDLPPDAYSDAGFLEFLKLPPE